MKEIGKRRVASIALIVSVLFGAAAGRGLCASVEKILETLNQLPAKERQARLEAEARKEEKIVYYTSFNPEDLQEIRERFEQRYHYLKLEPFRLGHGRLANRIRAEVLAGKLQADVISMPLVYISSLREMGAIAPNRTPLRAALKREYVDEAGWFNGLWGTVALFQYNTLRVKEADLPKNWNDLLDPKWKGRLALDQEGYVWLAGILDFMGEEKGKRFAWQLATQKIVVRRGHTLLSQLVMAGEIDMVLDQYDFAAYRAAKSGGPSGHFFLNPIITEEITAICVARTSPRPYAASLFMDFVLSKETQRFLSERGRRLSHQEVPYLLNPPSHYRWVYYNHEKWGKRFNELIETFRDIFLTR